MQETTLRLTRTSIALQVAACIRTKIDNVAVWGCYSFERHKCKDAHKTNPSYGHGLIVRCQNVHDPGG